MKDTIILDPADDVAIALRDIAEGETIDSGEQPIRALQAIPKGHKVLLRAVGQGQRVRKYGYSIGEASEDLPEGTWVHTHNLKSGLRGTGEYAYRPQAANPTGQGSDAPFFRGYVRENGDVGIRNEIWIVNTVGCINKTCETLVKLATRQFAGRAIDGVHHFAHPFGCSQLGDDLKMTQAFLTALAKHPNAAGVLVVGLGCENNQIDEMRRLLEPFPEKRIRFMSAQAEGDELETGLRHLEELVDYAETFKREPLPLSKLKIGMKCGGSDGFSGITANPLVGKIADAVTAEGGIALLTEVPEMFGAEDMLLARVENEQVFGKAVELINGFKQYFISHGQEIYENPSPGNKAGGITTLEEKSLGCTQKGGRATVTDVLMYGEVASKPGVNLVQAPGNDLVSVSALAAAGAHVVLFTTGRGTPFGGPVPTVKISTNSELAARKPNWIDFDAGRLLDGVAMDDLSAELLALIAKVASGEAEARNERFDYREIAIFKDGVIL
ncbi:UxaA family hydrolase [Paenibacillaceae bacterium WGS1546]|uniref:UxaA family hydrolase n=1 Tax=Cohnella sp. WGS1546 TaxID=3366810 RepID=UPI00372D13BB